MDFQLTPCEERLVVSQSRRSLFIGIPAEDSAEETRVPLTPQGVEILVAQGHRVVIQRSTGASARFSDISYSSVGAEIEDSPERVFAADIVLKVSPPTAEQALLMHSGQTLVCLIGRNMRDKKAFAILAEKKVNVVAADAMTDGETADPVLVRSLGEMEGMMAVTTAANMLEQSGGGKGIIIGGVTGVPPTEIVIVGADAAALSAARVAMAFGSNVKVFDTMHSRLQRLEWQMPHHVFTSVLHPQALMKALKSADVIICTRRVGSEQCFVIPSEYLATVKHDAVVVDLDIVAGGRTEVSRPTTLAEPVFRYGDLFIHSLPDITSLAPHSASIILSDIITPVISTIAREGGVERAARTDKPVASAVAMFRGTVTSKQLARRSGLEYFDLRLLLI